jgi:sugar O-acyltransferase (sialic acid O-acetyltransferase NeuD family)
MKNIAIYGAGGLGKEIACLLQAINESAPSWQLIGFFDDGKNKGKSISRYGKILGGINELNQWSEELSVVLAFGIPHTRFQVYNKINNPNISFPNIIHPNLRCLDISSLRIGIGNTITGNCIFSCDVSIGDFNLFNSQINLGHDVIIGSCNVFMPCTRISGETLIGNENLFGISSIVIQQMKIGDKVTLSPGSVLLHKPKSNSLYIGNPAKLFKY